MSIRTAVSARLSATVLTLATALALTGCTSGTEQSGGNSNPDSQVEQPPLPGETDPSEQGADGTGENDDQNSGDDETSDDADDN